MMQLKHVQFDKNVVVITNAVNKLAESQGKKL